MPREGQADPVARLRRSGHPEARSGRKADAGPLGSGEELSRVDGAGERYPDVEPAVRRVESRARWKNPAQLTHQGVGALGIGPCDRLEVALEGAVERDPVNDHRRQVVRAPARIQPPRLEQARNSLGAGQQPPEA